MELINDVGAAKPAMKLSLMSLWILSSSSLRHHSYRSYSRRAESASITSATMLSLQTERARQLTTIAPRELKGHILFQFRWCCWSSRCAPHHVDSIERVATWSPGQPSCRSEQTTGGRCIVSMSTGSTFIGAKASVLILQREGMLIERKNGTSDSADKSVPIHQQIGVIRSVMKESFFLRLFCLAMDPLFTYLNRIPGVLSVQGYIDDTTIAGNAQCLGWLEEVAHTYECLKTAGFVVDAHSCFRASVAIQNRRRPGATNSNEVENVWPGLIMSEPYPTALAALRAHNRPGYNTVVVRIGSDAAIPGDQDPSAPRTCTAGVFTYQQIQDITAGREMHQIGALAKVNCKCKSKSNIIVNAPS